MEVSGQLHALADLPPGKEPRHPFDRRVDGPQSRSGRCGEEKKSLNSCRKLNPGRPACGPCNTGNYKYLKIVSRANVKIWDNVNCKTIKIGNCNASKTYVVSTTYQYFVRHKFSIAMLIKFL
jgi:hypothetical protein